MANKVCLVLAEQPHRLVFRESMQALDHALASLGYEVTRANAPVEGARNVVFAPHLLLAVDEASKLPAGTIVYNGEPPHSPLFVRSCRLLGQKGVHVWDYSRASTEMLLGLGIPARTVPFGWAPQCVQWDRFKLFNTAKGFVRELMSSERRDVDVLFVGSRCPRRDRVLEELKSAGLRVQTLFGVYGAERDDWLIRSKVLLNVHYWDEGGCEDARLLLGAAFLCANVSEGSPDEPHKAAWAKWAPYERIAGECVDLVRSGEWVNQAVDGMAAAASFDLEAVVRAEMCEIECNEAIGKIVAKP